MGASKHHRRSSSRVMSQRDALVEKYRDASPVFVPVDLLTDNAVGTRIRRYRQQRGMSQEAVAAACGLSQSTISRAETHPQSIRLEDFARICEALSITVADLVEGQVKIVSKRGTRATGHITKGR